MATDHHLVITDSGLGGLSICAELERLLRRSGGAGGIRMTYVNAWPAEGVGYNDLPDTVARAAVFDRALAAIEAMAPDRIAIACNTLSILYEHTTRHRRGDAAIVGIVDTAVDLFHQTLAADPAGSLVILGTKTTIESGVYTERLVASGLRPERIAAVPCHGLAGAIETDPGGPRVGELIEQCTARAAAVAPDAGTLYLGLCCTHYTYVHERLGAALAGHSGRTVETLDPNARMAENLAAAISPRAPGAARVTVTSKVSLDAKRHSLARRLARVSPRTAAALLEYTHEPDLF